MSVVMEILTTIPLLARVLALLGILCLIASLWFSWRSNRRNQG